MRIHRRMSKYLKAANQTHKLFFFFLDKCVFIKPLNASSGFFGVFLFVLFWVFFTMASQTMMPTKRYLLFSPLMLVSI